MVTGAVKNHLKKALPQALAMALGELKLDEKFASLESKLAPAKPADPAPGEGKQPPSDVDKKFAALESQLAEEKAARSAAEKARQDAEDHRSFENARGALRTALEGSAKKEYLDDWVDRLTLIDKRLSVAEDGTPLLKVRHIPYKGQPEEDGEFTLDKAIPLLVGREEFKKYQPAPGAPSGERGSRGPRGPAARAALAGSTDPLDRAEAKMAELGINMNDEFG